MLIGVGGAIGLPLMAGVVLRGFTFRERLSRISDTNNLAAMSAVTSLHRHIE